MIPAAVLADSHGRILRDLRVSVTDRCNFRCLYCLPETEAAQNFYRGHWAKLPNSTPILQQWVPKAAILSFEEIERVIRVAAGFGNPGKGPGRLILAALTTRLRPAPPFVKLLGKCSHFGVFDRFESFDDRHLGGPGTWRASRASIEQTLEGRSDVTDAPRFDLSQRDQAHLKLLRIPGGSDLCRKPS